MAKLKDGVIGSKICRYFLETNSSLVPAEAGYLETVGDNEVNYRIIFDDGSISDWKVTFAPIDYTKSPGADRIEIESIEKFNEVM